MIGHARHGPSPGLHASATRHAEPKTDGGDHGDIHTVENI